MGTRIRCRLGILSFRSDGRRLLRRRDRAAQLLQVPLRDPFWRSYPVLDIHLGRQFAAWTILTGQLYRSRIPIFSGMIM